MTPCAEEQEYLHRIQHSLEMASGIVDQIIQRETARHRREMAREAELRIADALRDTLQRNGEGWLCEEHADDRARLACDVVWIVDPVDGTIELINGLPEWSISVGLVIARRAVAGGVYNPGTQELFVGSLNLGVKYNGQPASAAERKNLDGAEVLVSRQEFARGEWDCYKDARFAVRPLGSVAYRLALVSAGLTDATWTLSPRHEWDVAGGVALVNSAVGRVSLPAGAAPQFNRETPMLPGLIASGASLWSDVDRLLQAAKVGPRE
jgi:myo-inositol-1(or 4)-monophosphatase